MYSDLDVKRYDVAARRHARLDRGAITGAAEAARDMVVEVVLDLVEAALLLVDAEEALRAAVENGFKRAHPEFASKCAVHCVKVCQGVDVLEGKL